MQEAISLMFIAGGVLAVGAWLWVFSLQIRAHRAYRRGDGPLQGQRGQLYREMWYHAAERGELWFQRGGR